ncbi:BRCA1-associated RING domain protein 1 [Sesamum alatum]|uniref:BRCA1-associated RING domain protein 1 n=1 Tax=Sesamum alatum TaxID=300844 RepID=A0AAE1XVP0_9LAMI|nr:BRCA1-associated RING domain protein 1 [Sesamum alatum]
MSEIQSAARLLNPWVFHLQKLGLELKCPICLDLLNKPVLLPCNHIFCKFCVPKSRQCPACQQHYTDQDIRHASFLDNIVTIYKSLDATFNSTILPLLSADSGAPISISTSIDQLRTKSSETATRGKNDHSIALLSNHVASGTELVKWSVSEELDVNHAPEMSPGSSPSSGDAKNTEDHTNDLGSRHGSTENHRVKKSFGDNLGTATDGLDSNDTFHTREPKRQKKLNYGSPDAALGSHGYSQQIICHSDQAAVSNFSAECKFKENTAVISSPAACEESYANGSVCAFCHSSKITEGTGLLLHYANGMEVARGKDDLSKAIPVHSKCIEWSPQVYFVGETIKNLEAELVRSSKLKCSSCGLKGAALGCFAKSCRRSYHVPCALEIPECRWNCDDFLMLCPIHRTIKFPSEKSSSRKRHSGEKCSLPSQIASERLNFWATSASGPQKWVLCGSALSSEEKCFMVKFAGICDATVFKFWNPNVTHVIAATDSNGACSRTLKVLMAILKGRWVLTMDWIKACVEANGPVDEEPYEVNLDNHGCHNGPRNGRLRASNNAPKLFDSLSFYFSGDFVLSYKDDLLDLVRVGGGTIIESTEQIVAQKPNPQTVSTTYVVYNHDHPQGCLATESSSFVLKRLTDAELLAKNIGAQVIPHTWILESIAACRVLPCHSS